VITDNSVNNIKIKSNGANGKKEVAYIVEKINNRIEKKEVLSETILEKPKTRLWSKGPGYCRWPPVPAAIPVHWPGR
jgi:uncharacterized protein YabE (DUF348 family)